MDEVIQYRKDQKAGGGRLVYKGVKLNNRTMHNFRPTIGTVNTFGVNKQLMTVTVLEKMKIENMFFLFAGQFVSTYNICFATRVA